MANKPIAKAVRAEIVGQTTIDEKAVSKEVSVFQKQVDAITITDQESYANVATLLKQVKAWIKEKTDKYFTAKYDAIKALKASVDKDYEEHIEPAERLESALKKKMSDFLVAENNRKRLEAAKLKASLEKKADKAEDKGKDDKAEELRTQAAAIVPEKSVNTTGLGVSSKSDVEVTVTDLRSFLEFALEDKDCDLYALLDVKKGETKKMVKRLVPAVMKQIPGLKIEEKAVISA